ncbi:hypothetical protein ACA910_000316 [Epithemia clementina (nom. ined.)]
MKTTPFFLYLPFSWMAICSSASPTTASSSHVTRNTGSSTLSSSRTASSSTASSATTLSQVKVGHNAASPNLRIILIRHGESENNVHHEVSREQYMNHRQPDPPLTATGQEQAKETAHYLASQQNALLFPIDRIYVSPLRRTLMTARPIAQALQLNPIVWTDIYEVGGVHENGLGQGGLTRLEMQQICSQVIVTDSSRVTDQGWYDVSLGKESKEQARKRVAKVFAELQRQAKQARDDRTIALVVHGDFIDLFLQTALGWKNEGRWLFPCWNTCISVLDMDVTGRPMLLMHNAVSHLSTVKTHSLGKC